MSVPRPPARHSPAPSGATPPPTPRGSRSAREEQRFQGAWARRPARDPRYAWSNAGHAFLAQERERAVVRALARHGYLPHAGTTVLDVGCGTGYWLRDFIRWG